MFTFIFVAIFAIIPCAVFGYVIAIKQQRTLITFWDDAKYTDPTAAARALGNSLMLTASLLLFIQLLFAAGLIHESTAGLLSFASSALPVAALVYIRRRYAPSI
ncbi:MAG: hypothetical protein JJU03_01780 [Idiomarina sp.]|nr:hypothetical protein [Idiomarina sp.]